jgi:hypothetical protein
MARRGRCRCGYILKFHRGPSGYKTRCPGCGSVVRLRLPPKPPPLAPPPDQTRRLPRVATQVLDPAEAAWLGCPLKNPRPVTGNVVPASASAPPSRYLPVAVPRSARRCDVCGVALTTDDTLCSRCAAGQGLVAVEEIIQVEPWRGHAGPRRWGLWAALLGAVLALAASVCLAAFFWWR